MAQKLNPFSGRQFLDANGDPYSGAKLFTYLEGTSTKQTVTKDSAGLSNHANPIILNSKGEPADTGGSAQAIWQPDATNIKLVLAPASDTDPPSSPIATWDNLEGINDTVGSGASEQWVEGPTPTYVSATSFTLTGDQTATFHVGRRVKTTNSGGTVYGTIITSAYTTLTTITIVTDSGSLDSGLSAVSYGLLTALYDSLPIIIDGNAGSMMVVNAAENDYTPWAPKNHIAGLVLSNDAGDATHDVNITAGEATDSTDSYILKLTSEITKQIDATWAAGDDAGGMFTGSVAADTWYHVFLIRKDSDGTIDAGFDTSISAANIPTGYTAYRRIGSVLTDGSSLVLAFQMIEQHGGRRLVKWDVPDGMSSGGASTTATALTAQIPPGLKLEGIFKMSISTGAAASAGCHACLSDPDATASPFSGYGACVYVRGTVTYQEDTATFTVITDTSSQVKLDSSVTEANTIVAVACHGWYE